MSQISQSRLRDINKRCKQPSRRKRITLVFDEEKRREFLGGFRTRKLERKKKAQEKLQQQLKEEKKKIKQQARERYEKLLSHRNVPEIEQLLSRHEYDMEDHTVSILELNIGDLREGSRWIGQNKITKEEDCKNEHSNDNNDDSDNNDDEIVGMSLTDEQKTLEQQISRSDGKEIKSAKELKRNIRKAALQQIKKSKTFQQKQRLEQQKNKKESRRKLRKIKKLAHKHGKRVKKKAGH